MLVKRSTNYRNYFDKSSAVGFGKRPKLENGEWTSPFRPSIWGT